MGVDRRLFLSDRWRVADVKDTIESLFDVKVKYHSTTTPDYAILQFNYKDEDRQMNCHMNTEHGGFKGLLITLRAWGSSDKILRQIGERLGGFYNEEDVNSKFEEFQYVASGDLEFLLNEAVKEGKTDGRNTPKFREYLDECDEKHKAWEKENSKSIDKLLRGNK